MSVPELRHRYRLWQDELERVRPRFVLALEAEETAYAALQEALQEQDSIGQEQAREILATAEVARELLGLQLNRCLDRLRELAHPS
jgi:hypothetical protein